MFQKFVEQGNDIACYLDSDGIITYISPQIKRYGLNPDEIIGKSFLDSVYPEDRERLVRDFEKTISTGEEFPCVFRFSDKEGRIHWFEDYGAVQRDQSGKITGIVSSLRDITDHIKLRQELAQTSERCLLLSQTAGILLAESDLQCAIEKICGKVLKHLVCDFLLCYSVDESTGRLKLIAHTGIAKHEVKKIKRLDYGRAICGCVARDRKQIIAEDIAHSVAEETQVLRSLDVQAFCCHPLMASDRLFGTLGFGTRTRAHFTPDEVSLMKAIAEQITMAMDRIRVEQNLRESESQKALILDNTTEIIAFHDTDHNLKWVNRAFLEVTGRSPSEAKGAKCYQMWGMGQFCDDCPVTTAMETGMPCCGEITLLNQSHQPAEEISWQISAVPVKDNSGRIIGVIEAAFDITDRAKAEEKLRQSEQRLHLALQAARGGAWDWDLTGGEGWWSRELFELWGVTPEARISQGDALSPIHAQDRQILPNAAMEAIARHADFQCEYRVQHPLRGERWMISSGRPIYDESGQAVRLLGITRDITDFKQAQDAKQKSEHMFQAIFENSVDGILIADAETRRLTSANPAICRMLGYTLEELQQLNAADLHPTEQLGYAMTCFGQLRNGEVNLVQNVPLKRKDGHIFYAEVSGSSISLSGRDYVIGVFRDLTERNRLQQQIAEVSDYEQRRIGQALHDGLQQELIGLAFKCETLAETLSARNIAEADEIRKIGDLLDHAVAHSRDLSKLLCPVDNACRNSLVYALEELAEKTESLFGISCLFKHEGTISLQNPTVTNNLYRITQEAVTNAVKHGQAKHILIRMDGAQQKINLIIKDDGVGLPPDYQQRRGMGLHIMKYRVALMGAALYVRRDLELGGTIVMCSLSQKDLLETDDENKTG